MTVSRDSILQHLRTHRPLRARELARALKIPAKEYQRFRRLIQKMARDGDLVKLRNSRYGASGDTAPLVGRLTINPAGFGFIIPENGEADVFVSAGNLGTGLHGDKVIARRLPGIKRGPEGKIVKVLECANPVLVGILRRNGRFEFVEPDDPRHVISVSTGHTGSATPGQQVVVRIDSWPTGHRNPEGTVMEVLGDPEDPGNDDLVVTRSHGLSLDFPPPVQLEAERIPEAIPSAELGQRTDLRALPCITIDPVDARDHDDAVSLETNPDGSYRLGIHIADVSHYVRAGTLLDDEARSRGTSVYLVDRVIPMLPGRLSCNICSLKPCSDRLALTIFVHLTQLGETRRTEFLKSIIRVQWQGTYQQVQELIESGSCEQDPGEDLAYTVRQMEALRQRLSAFRADRGAIDFQIPEPEIILDESGHPVEVGRRARLPSHRLVEEFMLLANETVARKLKENGIPAIYRVHERPDPSKLKVYARVSAAFGHRFPKQAVPREIQKFVNRIGGDPTGDVLNSMLLRTMKKAIYSPENRGHFGLACAAYTHFTSPIRRYPDLWVHRQLKSWLWEKDGATEENQERLSSLADHATKREILAQKAEWDSIKIKQIRYLESHLDKDCEATVVGIRPVGIFAQLDKHLVQGLVKIRTVRDDFYVYNEADLVLKGQRTGRTFRLGSKITVQIDQVDRRARQVDLLLIKGGTVETRTRGLPDVRRGSGKSSGRRGVAGRRQRTRRT
jgi:ribonuclease R